MKQTIIESLELHKKLVAQFEAECLDTVAEIASMVAGILKQDGRIYICGNGGSAADAQHIACELVGRFMKERKALPAVAFTTDTSIMTAVANDYTFDEVFTRQVEAFVTDKDVLWAFSTSGESSNIVAAGKLAKEKNAKLLSFTGKAGSTLEKMSDMCICIDSPNAFSAQQIHQIAYHIICDLVEQQF